MAEKLLLMNAKERKRLQILHRVDRKEIIIKEAAILMDVSYRQALRIVKIYQAEGAKGLIHKSRGKPSNRAYPAEHKMKVIQRYRERYSGFGPTLASEKISEEGLQVSRFTLWRWLMESGDWEKKRNGKRYRAKRPGRPHFGEMVQLDGSYHNWFGDEQKKCNLMNMVDDATGTTLAMLSERETTEAAMRVLWQWISKHGIPHSIYTDRHMIYYHNNHEEGYKAVELTQFGRACHELGIKIIHARSAAAKGKVERKNSVYQDRFVKELWLRGINDMSEANRLLDNEFVKELNDKFAYSSASEVDFHYPLPKETDLAKIFSKREYRTVGNDWTIRWYSNIYQILDQPSLPPKNCRVEVREYLDGSLHIFYQGKEMQHRLFNKPRTPMNDRPANISLKTDKKEIYLLMKDLEKEGLSAKAIARVTKVSEHTVRGYLNNGLPGQRRTRSSVKTHLDNQRGQLFNWLEKGFSNKEIHQMLLHQGFEGSMSTVTKYLNKVKKEVAV